MSGAVVVDGRLSRESGSLAVSRSVRLLSVSACSSTSLVLQVDPDHRDHPALLALGKADPEVEAQGAGDLVGEERPHALAADPPDHLADEPAVRSGVVAVRGARVPHRALGRERLDGRLPRQPFLRRHGVVEDREPDLVGQQPAHRDVLLAGSGELGPVFGHRGVEVEFAPLGQQVGADRGRAFRAREHQDDAVFDPRPTGLHVGHSAPEVDHLHAPVIQAERSPDIAMLLEVGGKSVPYPLEAGSHCPAYLSRGRFIAECCPRSAGKRATERHHRKPAEVTPAEILQTSSRHGNHPLNLSSANNNGIPTIVKWMEPAHQPPWSPDHRRQQDDTSAWRCSASVCRAPDRTRWRCTGSPRGPAAATSACRSARSTHRHGGL